LIGRELADQERQVRAIFVTNVGNECGEVCFVCIVGSDDHITLTLNPKHADDLGRMASGGQRCETIEGKGIGTKVFGTKIAEGELGPE